MLPWLMFRLGVPPSLEVELIFIPIFKEKFDPFLYQSHKLWAELFPYKICIIFFF